MIRPLGPVSLPGSGRCVYEVHGFGEPLLCILNVAVSAEPLHSLARLFEDLGFALITIEELGDDIESTEDAARRLGTVLDDLGEPAWLWGYSQGACIAQELALQRPEVTLGAVLVATRGRLTYFLRAYLDALRSLSVDQSRASISSVLQVMASYGPESLADDVVATYAIERVHRISEQATPECYARSLDISLAYDDRLGALSSIQVPCLVVTFQNDVICPPELGNEVAAIMPGARQAMVKEAAHGGMFTHTQEIIDLLADFARQVTAAAPQRSRKEWHDVRARGAE